MQPTDIIVYPLLFLSLYFEVFILLAFLRNRVLNKAVPEIHLVDAELPTATVVIPVWNEEKTVVGTIESLLKLDYPKDKLHITVVNDGSTDNTASVLKQYDNNPQVTIIHKENGGKHTAVNLAIQQATSELIGCLDADSFVDPTALKEIVREFKRNPALSAVTPGIVVAHPKNILEKLQAGEYFLGAFMRYVFALLGVQFITPGPFSIFKMDVFKQIGTFRAAYNTEDLELGLRMQEAGMQIGNAPKARVETTAPRTFPKLARQRTRWAYGFLNNAIYSYRHLFFNAKLACLGFLMLPLTMIGILGGMFTFFLMIWNIALSVGQSLSRFGAVGINPPQFSTPQVDLFFAPNDAALFVIVALIVLTGVLIMLGMRLVGEKAHLNGNMIAYFLLYGLIAPIWLTKSIVDTVLRRGNLWR